MRTLHLKVNDNLYGILLAMLKGLPNEKIEIIEEDDDIDLLNMDNRKVVDIMECGGALKSFTKIDDPVAWQKEIRSEWSPKWDK